jgi:aryl-alcohol dehydrogenase-like predicted oxidoreductase
MNFAIGTAQFGENYGIANTKGQVSLEVAKLVLHCAREAGINTLDTAALYGVSEQCLGKLDLDGWRVITKLPNVPDYCTNIPEWVNNQIKASLARLAVNSVAATMLHRPKQLLQVNGQKLWSTMQDLKNKGMTEKIGYSMLTFDQEELDQLWKSFRPDIIQVPFSIVDQRFKTSGWLDKFHNNGIEVHVRSVFLQGLLLMNKEDRPEKFDRWSMFWEKLDLWLVEQKLTRLEACLSFVFNDPAIDHVVIGVDGVNQLKQIIGTSIKELSQIPQEFSVADQDLINPSNWKLL